MTRLGVIAFGVCLFIALSIGFVSWQNGYEAGKRDSAIQEMRAFEKGVEAGRYAEMMSQRALRRAESPPEATRAPVPIMTGAPRTQEAS